MNKANCYTAPSSSSSSPKTTTFAKNPNPSPLFLLSLPPPLFLPLSLHLQLCPLLPLSLRPPRQPLPLRLLPPFHPPRPSPYNNSPTTALAVLPACLACANNTAPLPLPSPALAPRTPLPSNLLPIPPSLLLQGASVLVGANALRCRAGMCMSGWVGERRERRNDKAVGEQAAATMCSMRSFASSVSR